MSTTPTGAGLRRMWSAVAMSSLGDGAFMAALPLAAAALTRNPTAVALVTTAMYLPWLLVTPLAGALVDRWPFRPTMVLADVIRAAGLAGLALLIAFGETTIPLLCLAAFAVVVGQIFHDTALQGSVVALAGRDTATLERVNGRIYGTETAGRQLIGPPLGSATYALFPWLPFAVDAVSFAGSAAAVAGLPAGLRSSAEGQRQRLFVAIKAGAMWLLRHRQLRMITVCSGTANFTYNMALATFVLLATSSDGLGIAVGQFGLLLAAQAVGGSLAGFLTARLSSRLGGPGRTVLVITGVHAVAWPLVALTHSPWIAAPLLAIVGAAQSIQTVINVSTRQAVVPAAMLGSVIAAMRTIGNSASPIGAILGGLIATQWGLRTPLLVGGVVLVAAMLVAAPTLARWKS